MSVDVKQYTIWSPPIHLLLYLLSIHCCCRGRLVPRERTGLQSTARQPHHLHTYCRGNSVSIGPALACFWTVGIILRNTIIYSLIVSLHCFPSVLHPNPWHQPCYPCSTCCQHLPSQSFPSTLSSPQLWPVFHSLDTRVCISVQHSAQSGPGHRQLLAWLLFFQCLGVSRF